VGGFDGNDNIGRAFSIPQFSVNLRQISLCPRPKSVGACIASKQLNKEPGSQEKKNAPRRCREACCDLVRREAVQLEAIMYPEPSASEG